MLRGWRIADLAIAAGYAMLDAADPLATLAALVRGAAREFSYDDVELEVVWALVCLRLALSASIAIDQQRARPDNDYLGVSQAAIRRTLPRLTDVHYEFAVAVGRDAAGREPSPKAKRVTDWLQANVETFASVLEVDLRTEPCVVLDLGVASPLVSGDPDENAEPELTPRIESLMRERLAGVASGGTTSHGYSTAHHSLAVRRLTMSAGRSISVSISLPKPVRRCTRHWTASFTRSPTTPQRRTTGRSSCCAIGLTVVSNSSRFTAI